ncbi:MULTISPECIES: ABC transporter substrate-binding protein [unclassified Pseudomonas]|uniref:substrate-binding periplasmic protein n=1 Tax=unclassified Pseudomonas TaxID=196821 RepID=UPI000BCF8F01|nr:MULTISPECIES: transporter substrate-binding domain-containing protein [unclassified Pseudomonas]PVZ19475.1 polar amino acid transport system substrate-binding protein [Pseudomonas sp. URIL14HWK12:I12]PVZ22940.1 polar amino acid transport system substrate-binding protein [Pseudomonas sp. URIL14HWK12:I10]PVZ37430.1 polar amino acid transport system substrate-binding protein [Pseudomonas sp. URIL14HWK12:I11]SNZ14767.1 polar amino acid transport system substrate-binding protein [Pseudomonas sp. 
MKGRWLGLALGWLCLCTQAAPLQVVTEESSYSYYQGGELKGPATDAADALLARAGLPRSITLYPWARAYDLALAEPDVLIFPLIRTRERESRFEWIGQFAQIHTLLYRLQRRDDIQLSKLDDARQYTLGVVRDDFREAYLRGQGFTRLVVSASAEDNARKLLNGQVDLIPLAEADAARYFAQNNGPAHPLVPVLRLDQLTAKAWFAMSKGSTAETVQALREAFDALKANGVFDALGR